MATQEDLKRILERKRKAKKVKSLLAGSDSPSGQDPFKVGFLPPGMRRDETGKDERALGSLARDAVQGALAIPAMGMDLIATGVYKALDAAGIEHKDAYMAPAIRQTLIDAGLPEPEGGVEEFVSAVNQGLASGGSSLALGRAMAKSASPVTSKIGQAIAERPAVAVASGGTGAGGSDVARQAGFGPTAQFVAGTATGMLGGARVPKKTPLIKPTRANLVEHAENALGVKSKATSAQKSLKSMDVAGQEVVTHLPKIQQVLKLQNTQASKALAKFMDDIAPDQGTTKAGVAGRAASDKTLIGLREIQKKAASPHYKAAEINQKTPVDTKALVTKVMKLAKENDAGVDPLTDKKIPSPVQDTLEEFAARIRAQRGDIGKLHKQKEWLDRRLSSYGDDAMDRDAARIMKTEVKDDFLDLLISSSDDYKKGYEEFIRTQKPIDEMRNSLVGILSDTKKNVNLEGTLNKIFNSDIVEVKALKRVLDGQDPRAFPAMYRSYLQKLMDKSSVSANTGENVTNLAANVPNEFWNNIFKGKTYKILSETAPTDGAKKNLAYLRHVMSSYRAGRGINSTSPERIVVRKQIEGFHGALARFFSAAKFRPVGETLAESTKFLAQKGIERRTRALVDVLVDPQYEDAMAAIRRIDPKSARSARLTEQLLLRAADNLEEQITEEQ